MLYSQFESAFDRSFYSQQEGVKALFDVFKEDAIARIFQLRDTVNQLQDWMKASLFVAQCCLVGLLVATLATALLPIVAIVALVAAILMPLGMIAAIAVAVYGLICRVILLLGLISFSFLAIVPLTLMAFGQLLTDIWTWATNKLNPSSTPLQYFADCEEINPEVELMETTVCSLVLYEQQSDITWVNNGIEMQRSLPMSEVTPKTPSLQSHEFIIDLVLSRVITTLLVTSLDSFPLEALQILCEELEIEVNPDAKAKNLRKKIRRAVRLA